MQAEDIIAKKKKLLWLRTILLPPVTFIRFYLWKLGILDGFPGLVIALVSSWGTAMKYLKALELKRKEQGGSFEKSPPCTPHKTFVKGRESGREG